jgi:hypothetical protein
MNIDNDDGVAPNALRGGTRMKYVDNKYSDGAGNVIPAGTQMLAIQTDIGVQRWQDGKATVEWRNPETGKLPDPEDLNEKIPMAQWENGLDGKPKPPWGYVYCVYLLDMNSGKKWSYVHDTTSAKIAYQELKNSIQNKKILCGVELLPVVELRCGTTWRSRKFGLVPRPDFNPVKWLRRGDDGALVLAADPLKQLGGGAQVAQAPPRQIAAQPAPAHQPGQAAQPKPAQQAPPDEDSGPIPPADYYDDYIPFN